MSSDGLDPFSAKQAETTQELTVDATGAAFIIVDMVNDFCDPAGAMPLPGADALLPAINSIATAFRSAGAPVVWVCDRHDSLEDAEFRKRAPHCLAGTWGTEIYHKLSPEPGDREQPKHRFSSFFETDLHEWLQQNGVTTLIVCGVVTNICVRATVQDAFFLGYDVIVAEDASAATSDREQASALHDMATHMASIASSAEIIDAVGRGSLSA